MRNEPVKGNVMPKAVVTAHTSAAPNSHTGRDHVSAAKNSLGLRVTLSPTPKCSTAVAMRLPSPVGSARVHHAVTAARRSGWAAMAQTVTSRARAPADATPAEASIERKARGDIVVVSAKPNTY